MPNRSSLADVRLLGYIRRVNLDIFWSREPSTVQSVLSTARKGKALSEELGLEPMPPRRGPWPVGDTQGMQLCVEVLRYSQREGKNHPGYVQFDSIRKLRSAYSNAYECSPAGCITTTAFKGSYGRTMKLTHSPTDSALVRMFMRGCEKRMGRLVYQDLGLSMEMLLTMLEAWETELADAGCGNVRRRNLVVAGAAFAVLFAGALRGGEVLLMEASELVKRRKDGQRHSSHPHIVIPLMGRFKGETGERNVLLALANETKSGLKVRVWVSRLIRLLVAERKHEIVGPAICNADGYAMERWKLNGLLHEGLGAVQSKRDDLIGDSIKVEEKFSIHRSFRRGATTQAKENNVPEKTIEINNRWRKVENRSGGLPSLPMSELYVEITQALGSRTRFSESL